MGESISLALLGLVEGVTEFLPVSSTGHLILVRDWIGRATPDGLAVDAVLQLATVLALIVYFWRDILSLVYTFLYTVTGRPVSSEERGLLVAIVVGTVPAIIFGLLLESYMDTVFRSATLVAYALLAGSAIMLAAEYYGRRMSIGAVPGWRQGLVVGLFQCIALIPGMSRSGMTIAGGMFWGLSRSDAARFGFLLSIPILVGSGLKKLYDLQVAGVVDAMGPSLLVGSAVAFVSGLLAVHLLLLIVRNTPLTVFVVYRVLLAVLILAVL